MTNNKGLALAQKAYSMTRRGIEQNRLVMFDGAKAVTIWGDEGWSILSGNDKERPDTEVYYSARVPTVYRGMQLRANGVASIPFDLVDANTGETVDTSDDWQNVCGFLSNPAALFWKVEAARTVSGKAYIYRSANRDGYIKVFRPLAPNSVVYNPSKRNFTRSVQVNDGTTTNQTYPLPLDEDGNYTPGEAIVPLWISDPDVEFGPPLKFPGKAAMQAMGVLFNLDEAATGFFKRGMLHTYIFSVPPGTQQADKDALEDKIKNMLTGIKNAWRTIFINAQKVEPIDIGGGLEELANIELTREKREDTSIALGVPMSKLFSENANSLGGKGVVDADDRRLIADTCLPEWREIAQALNEMVFIPAGYRLIEHHEKMQIFQENESDRASALGAYVSAFSQDVELANVLAQALGLKLPDDLQAQIDAIISKKQERAETMPTPPQLPAAAQSNPVANDPLAQTNTPDMPAEKSGDWDKLRRKALKNIGKAIDFQSDTIPDDDLVQILEALPGCKTAAEVNALFEGEPPADKLTPLLARAIEILEAVRE